MLQFTWLFPSTATPFFGITTSEMPGNANMEQAISERHITNYPEKAAYN